MDYTVKDTVYVKLGIIFSGLSATLIFEITCSVEDDDLSLPVYRTKFFILEERRKIRLIEGNAKCHLKKFT
jgi:hypothetical protein